MSMNTWGTGATGAAQAGARMRAGTARRLTIVGLLGALSALLMFFQLSVPFAPPFYKLDLSEVPALMGAFVLGPVAAVEIEVVKIILKCVFLGSDTAFWGEAMNLIGNIIFVVPVALIYRKHKNQKGALVAVLVGVAIRLAWSSFCNVYISLPMYARIYGWPIEQLIGMGTAVNPNITDMRTFVLYAILPFNLLKSSVVAFVTLRLVRSQRLLKHLSGQEVGA